MQKKTEEIKWVLAQAFGWEKGKIAYGTIKNFD